MKNNLTPGPNRVIDILAGFCQFSLFVFFLLSCNSREDTSPVHLSDEVSSRLVAVASGEIYFTKRRNDVLALHRYKNDSVFSLSDGVRDIFNPFCVLDSVYGMEDDQGDQNFVVNSPALHAAMGGKPIRNLYASQLSPTIIYNHVNEKILYLYDVNKNKKIELFVYKDDVFGVDFSKEHIVVSADKSLYLIDPATYSVEVIAEEMDGEKLNPSISGNEVYFVNNGSTEFLNIYKVALDGSRAATHCYGSDADLVMPKIDKGRLYFLEIRESKYLLSFLDKNRNKETITRDGVVFSYLLAGDDVIFTYSDINLPRSLCRYNLSSRKTIFYDSRRPKTDVLASFVTSPSGNSYGYKIASSKHSARPKGVILMMKGGIPGRSDFSPRWDDILVNLASNGYTIYVPNFRTSVGYGKSYLKHTSDEAILDLLEWKKFISREHPQLNLYLFSISSGNLYLEEVLKRDSEGIKGVASLVGLHSGPPSRNLSPALYILGKNDHNFSAESRRRNIWWNSFFMMNKEVIMYDDEGHLLRRKANIVHATRSLMAFFSE